MEDKRCVFNLTLKVLDAVKNPLNEAGIASLVSWCGDDYDDTRRRSRHASAVDVLMSTCKDTATAIARKQLQHTDSVHFATNDIKFRRITNRRLQAMHILGSIAIVYESTSLYEPFWLVRRIKLAEDDDEEYYWKLWEDSLQDAEHEYTSCSRDNIDLDDILQIKSELQHSGSSTATNSSVSTFASTTRRPTLLKPVGYEFEHLESIDDNDEDAYWNRYGTD